MTIGDVFFKMLWEQHSSYWQQSQSLGSGYTYTKEIESEGQYAQNCSRWANTPLVRC